MKVTHDMDVFRLRKVKPCPFCGSKLVWAKQCHTLLLPWRVYCGECAAGTGYTLTRSEAFGIWQARPRT